MIPIYHLSTSGVIIHLFKNILVEVENEVFLSPKNDAYGNVTADLFASMSDVVYVCDKIDGGYVFGVDGKNVVVDGKTAYVVDGGDVEIDDDICSSDRNVVVLWASLVLSWLLELSWLS